MLWTSPRRLPTEEEVRRANRLVYNRATVQSYNRNKSIFNERQLLRIGSLLRELREATGGERFLDVGCGTGNLLLTAQEIFPHHAPAPVSLADKDRKKKLIKAQLICPPAEVSPEKYLLSLMSWVG